MAAEPVGDLLIRQHLISKLPPETWTRHKPNYIYIYIYIYILINRNVIQKGFFVAICAICIYVSSEFHTLVLKTHARSLIIRS